MYRREHSNSYLQCPVSHIGFYFFSSILKQLDCNFGIELMEFSDYLWKKAGPNHGRQADANMSLFQIAQVVEFSGQILKGSYN
ncbi:hypothetical protein D3C78_1533930 [compost metagenome]